MIYVVNYASGRFRESQRLQNVAWLRRAGTVPPVVCSFSKPDVLPILESLHLHNEDDIRRVLNQPRGDGLWAWKAILTYHVYRDVARTGDVVFYMDSGACPTASFDGVWKHIRDHGHLFVRVSAFETVPNAIRDHGHLFVRASAFETGPNVNRWLEPRPTVQTASADVDTLDFSCRLWTKPLPPGPGNEHGLPRCVLERLSHVQGPLSEASARLMSMEQVCGGLQGYLKAGENAKILTDLLDATSPAFFDDEVRGAVTHGYFDHRQDQSILSLIVNAECMRVPAFASAIVNRLDEVRLHRGSEPAPRGGRWKLDSSAPASSGG